MSKVRNNFAWEIVLIACNLRLAIIILTPLIDKIGETFKLSTVQLGILTTIPLLCFGFISILISLLWESTNLIEEFLLFNTFSFVVLDSICACITEYGA